MIDLEQNPVDVAPQLLGMVVRHAGVSVRLTEVEAYCGVDDPASHAFRGPTPRTRVMFGPASHLYVYLSYGIHLAANIVCGADGVAGAVLLRSGEVVDGLELARERRAATRRSGTPPRDHELGRGPGCLGQVLALQLADSGAVVRRAGAGTAGAVAVGRDDFLLLSGHAPQAIASGPRVGISKAVDLPWRFWEPGAPSVSRMPARQPGGTPRAR